jgi:hypothetical protein
VLWDVSTLGTVVPPPGLYGVVGTGVLWDVSTLCAVVCLDYEPGGSYPSHAVRPGPWVSRRSGGAGSASSSTLLSRKPLSELLALFTSATRSHCGGSASTHIIFMCSRCRFQVSLFEPSIKALTRSESAYMAHRRGSTCGGSASTLNVSVGPRERHVVGAALVVGVMLTWRRVKHVKCKTHICVANRDDPYTPNKAWLGGYTR